MTSVLAAADRARRYYVRRLSPPAAWHRALDASWRRPSAGHPPVPPTWPSTSAERARLTLHWPDPYPGPAAAFLCGPLAAGLRRLVRVEPAAIGGHPEGHLLFDAVLDGREHRLAVVFSDYRELPAETIRDCDLVFKMQYDAAGYGSDRVVPIGHAIGGDDLLAFLPRLRRLSEGRPKYAVSARFSPNFAPDVRLRAMDLLQTQRRFPVQGGSVLVGYGRFLRESALSKVCVDVPGQGDFCTRLTDLLAIGACIVAWPHRTVMPVPLVDGEHLVLCRPDLGDLVERCEELLHDDARRRALQTAASNYFDRYAHPQQLAGLLVRTVIDRLG